MSSDELKKQLLAQKLHRSMKRKLESAKFSQSVESKKFKSSNQTKESEELPRRAIAEIEKDTQRAAKLAEEIGPSGWRKTTTQKTNKRFLANTMKSVLSHNERTTVKHEKESKRKFEELSKRPPKFGSRLHSFQSSTERMPKHKKSDSI